MTHGTLALASLVDALWNKDQHGCKNPQELVDTRWLHAKTNRLYIVTGYSFNATYDAWDIHYDREDHAKRGEFWFTRRMAEFLDGRFIKVE